MHETLLAVVVRLHVIAPKYTDNFQPIIVRIIITNSEVKVVPEHTWWRQVWDYSTEQGLRKLSFSYRWVVRFTSQPRYPWR